MLGVRRRASPFSVPFTRRPLHGFLCRRTYGLVSSLTVNGTRCRRSRLSLSRDDDDDDDDNDDMYVYTLCRGQSCASQRTNAVDIMTR